MKGSIRTLMVIFSVTAAMLFYVHWQVMSYVVSYRIHDYSREIGRQQDEVRRMSYNLEMLKAPKILDQKMKQHSLDMVPPDQIRTLTLPQSAPSFRGAAGEGVFRSVLNGFFADWIQIARAEAQPVE